ncbi:hypothetical protein N1851_006480 [Merluccius polli]|uniref:Uncharacterized protein n=1 Tax=Merluccius polli TaxID=89951 RepID=A0AA47N496_MERPO|nr:hypothetical protein N1851_006480 [Merluccius polli]
MSTQKLFYEDCCVPSRTRVSYNNDKPWFTAKLRRLRLDKEEAFRSGDKDRFKEAKYKFSKAVKEAKRLYSEKLQHQFSANDSASVWKGLRQITNYKPKVPHSINDQRLANNLNEFYYRFERQRDSAATFPHDSFQQLQLQGLGTSTNAHLKVTTLSIHERDVNKLFRRQNPRKAAGPDSVSPSTLKHCADQLSPVFTDIFNTSLETCHVPACFKTSTIIPVPKKPRTTGLNDVRPSLGQGHCWNTTIPLENDAVRRSCIPPPPHSPQTPVVVVDSIWDLIVSMTPRLWCQARRLSRPSHSRTIHTYIHTYIQISNHPPHYPHPTPLPLLCF